MLLAAELRRRLAAWVTLALVAGLAGAFVLTATAGARRTASAYSRFRADTRSPDLTFSPPPDADPTLIDRVRALPGVVAAVGFTYLPVVPDRPGIEPYQDAGAFVAVGPEFGDTVYRYRVLDGRRADPRRADEVTVNRELAKLAHLRVGDRIPLKSAGDLVHDEATVVAIHRGEFDVGHNATSPAMLLTPAFAERYLDRFKDLIPELKPAYFVKTEEHDSGAAKRAAAAVDTLYGKGSIAAPFGDVTVDAIRVQAVALTALAVIAGMAALVTVAQATGRIVAVGAAERATWGSLGMTAAQRGRAAAAPALVAGVAAATMAVTAAAGASSLLPRGLAGLVEPNPGTRIDLPVLGLGAAALLLVLLTAARIAAWREPRRGSTRSTPEARWLGRLGWSAPSMVGLRAAVGGLTAASRAQARAALAAAVVAVGGVTAVAVFAGSQSHLLATPSLHGWAFDFTLRPPPERLAALRDQAVRSPGVAGLAQVDFGHAQVGKIAAEVMTFEPLRGGVHPTLVDGRAPTAPDEIALAPSVARRAHTGVGRTVTVTGPAGKARMTVVGRAAYPAIGPDGDFDNEASMTPAGYERLGLASTQLQGPGVLAEHAAMLLVRVAPGAKGAAADRALSRAAGQDAEIVRPFLPPQLTNLRRAGDAPTVLSGFLIALGAVALVHALFVAIRAGRRDFAVLRALGFVRGQVRALLGWHASAGILFGVVVGVPVGIALGRLTWALVSNRLGVLDRPAVEAPLLAIVVAASIALANSVALACSRRAVRFRPAEVLRTE